MRTSQAHFYSHEIFIVQIGNVGYHSVIIVSSLPDSHLFLYESEIEFKRKVGLYSDWLGDEIIVQLPMEKYDEQHV